MRQKGFTLLELLLTLAITGILITGALMSIERIVSGTFSGRNQVTVLTDVDRVVLAVKKDLSMTQNTNLTDGVPFLLTEGVMVTLNWVDYTSSFTSQSTFAHYSSYQMSGTNLKRTYDGKESIVGRYITSITFTQNGKAINLTITATSPGIQERRETLQFTGYLRAESIE